jgi:N-acylneuraminate cytidylyltransferase
VRLIVFDFDGVLTDNRVWVSEGGEEWVVCDRSDGLGLEQLRKLGYELFVISSERNAVVGERCRKLGLSFAQGVTNKAGCLKQLIQDRGFDSSQVIYVGNDTNDLECMRIVACGVAVADAHPSVLAEADWILERHGGNGAVRELCDRLTAYRNQKG